MKRTLIFSVIFTLLASGAAAYEQIKLVGQITNASFIKPSAAAQFAGKVFVADAKANAVMVFDEGGKLLKRSSAPLKEPGALAVGGGRVYVADTGNSRIVVLDADGALLWSFAGGGSLPGQLDGPQGVAFGPDSRVYVSNTGNSRVEVYNSDGIFLYGFPVLKADGSQLSPGKISADAAGFIYVSYPGSGFVAKYDRSGKQVKEFDFANDGVAVDPYGMLYLISSKEGKVREVKVSGEISGTFGTKGKGKSEFMKLRDVAIGSGGELYLVDETSQKVTIMKLEGEPAGPRLANATPPGRFNLKGPVAKFAAKAQTFAVRSDGAAAAWLPEAREVALLYGSGGKKTLMRYGDQQGQVKNPAGMVFDLKGQLYVADTGNGRVQIFDSSGAFSNVFGEKAGFMGGGGKEGQFDAPSGLVVSSKGVIYIADTGNKRLQAFNSEGIFLFAVGPQLGNISLQKPVSVTCDNNRNLYILDAALKKVIVTDANGKFLRAWDDSGALADPAAIDYDGKSYFYILDRGASDVKIFDGNGAYIASFFARGSGERELSDPRALAVSDNRLYLSDFGGGRITAFDLAYSPEAPYAVKAAADEKTVKLSWGSRQTPWLKNFAVLRADSEDGQYKQVGTSEAASFEDAALSSGSTYYYAVAGVSITGDAGERSPALAVYFEGPKTPKPVVEISAADEPPAKNAPPVEIIPVELNYIFSANYKYYLNKPIGRIVVRNNTALDFSNVKVSFNLKDFMDFPTDVIVKDLPAGKKETVELKATLNNRILNITEDTPIQSQLTVAWYQDGVEKTSTLNKPIKVLSKNAIVWDKPQRLANFITPKDTPVFAFSRFALNEKSKFQDEAGELDDSVLTALMVWEALGEQGISYLSDPVSPYAVLKSSHEFVLDTVQFPRTTLKLKSGDCDDTTALFASILEAAGVRTALLDYPAHIALMFDTGETDARQVGIPEEFLIKNDNTWWVGLETTMVGKDFYDAVKHEADLYLRSGADARVFEVRAAWTEFEPVTLPETQDEAAPDKEKFIAGVKNSVAAMLKARYEYFKEYYGRILAANPDDADANLNLGILTAHSGETDAAVKYFGAVLEKEPFNPAALNNLGNTAFEKKSYEEAKKYYFDAAKADPYDADIWLNLARVADKLGRKDDVKVFVDRAAKIDPAVKGTGDKLLK